MTDGRKYRPAHRASRTPLRRRPVVPTVAAMTLGLTVGLTGVGALAPASADDLDGRIDRAQADVSRLETVAQQRSAAQGRVQDRVGASEERAEGLTERIRKERRLAEALRTQVAQEVLGEDSSGTSGASVAVADSLPEESEELLAGVAVVTQDTGGRAERIAEASVAVDRLRERRADVREVLQQRRVKADQLDSRADRAGAAVAAGQERLEELQAEKQAAEEEAAAEKASSSAVAYAMAQVGKSYVWGASGPDAFDCSGLTMAAWSTQGVSLPHNSAAQYASGTPVSESELQPGDLVFYYSPISHVGLYVGNGQVVNALNPGSGVQVSGLHDMPYSGAVRPG